MATSPQFTGTPRNPWCKVTAADGSTDGTDADVQLLMTAGASGSFLEKIILHPISTSGSTTTSAAAVRIYLNNGSSVGTGTNNVLFKQVTMPAISVNVTGTTAPNNDNEVFLNMQIEAGYRIYIGVTAMAANTQWNCVAVTGEY